MPPLIPTSTVSTVTETVYLHVLYHTKSRVQAGTAELEVVEAPAIFQYHCMNIDSQNSSYKFINIHKFYTSISKYLLVEEVYECTHEIP